MAKKPSPLDIMNAIGGAAHQKAQPAPEKEPDADDAPPAKAAKKAAKKPFPKKDAPLQN